MLSHPYYQEKKKRKAAKIPLTCFNAFSLGTLHGWKLSQMKAQI